ncbi:hypothetical protein, partial [Streptomyces ureilyticus]|uniref:hypothetical protein n=1 Tax=Streptomyces ureilyticus TaxID=1775131 RepID=UPI0019D18302
PDPSVQAQFVLRVREELRAIVALVLIIVIGAVSARWAKRAASSAPLWSAMTPPGSWRWPSPRSSRSPRCWSRTAKWR